MIARATKGLCALGLALSGLGCGLIIGIEDLSGTGVTSSAGGAGGSAGGAGGGGGCTMGCPGGVVYARGFGSPGDDVGSRVAVAGDGSTFVVGEQSGPIDFGGGPKSGAVFLVRLDATGKHQFSTALVNGSHPNVAVGPDNGPVVTGDYVNTVTFGGTMFPGPGAFVAKSAPNGSPLWAKAFSTAGGHVSIHAVAASGGGEVAVAGELQGAVDFGAPVGVITSSGSGADVFVAKIDASGALMWVKAFGAGGATQNVANAVSFGGPAGGQVVITGKLQGMLDFGTGALPAGGGMFLTWLDGAGKALKAKRFANANGLGLARDAGGAVVVAGGTNGPVDFGGGVILANRGFLAKFTSNADLAFSKETSMLGNVGVSIDPKGNTLLIGTFSGAGNVGGADLPSAGGADIVVAKFAGADGKHIWSERFGGAVADKGLGIAADGDKAVLVTGSFAESVDFGASKLTSAGNTDVWIARLLP